MDNVIHHSVQEKVNNLTVPSRKRKQFRCAFFNFKGGANATGAWSYGGVKTTVINDTHVRCNSSHLTSFVVLVSVVNDPGLTVSLFYYSYLLTIVDCMRTIADITAGLSHSCSLFYTVCIYHCDCVFATIHTSHAHFYLLYSFCSSRLHWTTSLTLVAAFPSYVCLPPLHSSCH